VPDFRDIRTLFDINGGDHGFADAELALWEQILGVPLPQVLRAYYAQLGRHQAVNTSHNRLLIGPNEIVVSDENTLVFFEENQAVVRWGIRRSDLHLDDPPVVGNYAPSHAQGDWHAEAATTSDFLLMMAVSNGCLGGLLYNANCMGPVRGEVVDVIRGRWSAQPAVSHPKQVIFANDFRSVVSVSFDDDGNGSGVFVGSSHHQAYVDMMNLLDVAWDYRSDEDEA
jgi:hypothetical protein